MQGLQPQHMGKVAGCFSLTPALALPLPLPLPFSACARASSGQGNVGYCTKR